MESRSKFHLCPILMLFLHQCALTRAQNFQREKHGLSFAKFVKASSVKLNALKLASLMVSKLGECTFECVNNQECYSVNFGRDSPDGKHSCELLEEDKFKQPSDLVVSGVSTITTLREKIAETRVHAQRFGSWHDEMRTRKAAFERHAGYSKD
ncbi:hypothetical protein OS493_032890 [Desmophyllum pertusum]|uniref:Apple domain-containing protein n=1 Tax=Desmophyllum pertusum TaxID=174260 RepID=A0A9X0CIG7_9CNID|nr:hypothetical protein OS493_032890 [Desmophyllum pertusum]